MLTFPLTTADFWDRLPIRSVIWDDPETVETGMTGRGETLSAELAPQLWQATVTLGRCKPEETAWIEAMLSVLRTPGRSFMAYHPARRYPLLDPEGLIITGAAVTLLSIPSARTIRLAGLPARFPLASGDYLAWSVDSGRRALHRVVSPVAADASGETPVFEVSPMLVPGATVGTAVQLVRASCAMQIVPRSIQPGSTYAGWSDGTSFRCAQTMARV